MSTEYIQFPSTASQAIPTVPSVASLPVVGVYDGQIYLTLDTDSLYAWNLATTTWVLLNSASTVTGSGAAGKMAVWSSSTNLSVSSATGVASLASGALNTTANGTADQLFAMNHTASGYEYKTLTGTTNQVTVTGSAGAITLALPQSINTGASVTFANLTLSALNSAGVVHTDGSGVFSTSLIVNADINASAAIAYSKLSLSNSIVNADINASAAIAYSKLSLTGSILNADLAGSIAASKLIGTDIATVGTLTAGSWHSTVIGALYGGTGGNSSASTGIAHVAAGTWSYSQIVNADVSSSAAIATSKIALTAPTQQIFTSTGSTTAWILTITSITSLVIGDIYSDNVTGSKYQVVAAANSGTLGYFVATAPLNGPPGNNAYIQFSGSGQGSFTVTASQAMATYTTPANVLYLRLRMVGGGGGGGGATANSGTNGTSTVFIGSLVNSANGGVKGNASAGAGGAGGTASLGFGSGTVLSGGSGGSGGHVASPEDVNMPGANGGNSIFGGGGGGGLASAGIAGSANTGGGGGGGGGNAGTNSGGAGGAGGFIDAIITSPISTYYYAVGTGGAGGAAGLNAGGNGAAGYIEVTEYYQ